MKKPAVLAFALACVLSLVGCHQISDESGPLVAVGDFPAAIMVDDVMYYLVCPIPAEIDESAIIGYTTSYTGEMPQSNGETNFNREINMPYAKIEDGIAVLNQNEWWFCEAKKTDQAQIDEGVSHGRDHCHLYPICVFRISIYGKYPFFS